MRWLFCLALVQSLFAKPPMQVPPDLYDAYTLGGKVPVSPWYRDDSYPAEKPLVFTRDEIEGYIEKVKQRGMGYYGLTDVYLYDLIESHLSAIEAKSVGIIGTTVPWYESIVLAFGGYPTTIEYNKIVSEDPRIEVMTVEEYWMNPKQFDTILSISSIEHDGLGRYGDPINPTGDLETMQKMKGMLKEGGVLFLSVPVGQDTLFWNVHRRYGKIRLPMLFEGWNLLETAGFSESDFSVEEYNGHQPLFLLQPNGS